MSAEHTPAPWHIANGVQIRSARHQIAKVWMMRNGEGKANARLIAAAPDLLEALTNLVKALDSTTWSSWQTTATFDDQLKAARAALDVVGEQV